MTVGTSNTEAPKWKYDQSDEFLSKDLPPTFHSYLSGAIIEMKAINLGSYRRETSQMSIVWTMKIEDAPFLTWVFDTLSHINTSSVASAFSHVSTILPIVYWHMPLWHSVIVQITISKVNLITSPQMMQTKSIYPTNRVSFHHNMWQNGIPEWLSKRQKS